MPDLSWATAFVDLRVRGNLDESLRKYQEQFKQTTNAARTFASFAGSGAGQRYFDKEYAANLQNGNDQLKTATAQLRAQLGIITSPAGIRAARSSVSAMARCVSSAKAAT